MKFVATGYRESSGREREREVEQILRILLLH